MSKNRHIINFLNNYVESENIEYAVMLNGRWGIGKTFFIKKLIQKWSEHKIKNGNYIQLKPIYISLNGVTTLSQINTKINEALYPILQTKGVRFLKKISNGAVKGLLKIDLSDSNDLSVEVDVLSLFKSDNDKIKGNKVLIFDDLERCQLNIKETLGYINDLSEHNNCKVILIADEDKIKSDDYSSIKEKVIGNTLQINIDYNQIFNDIINAIEHEKSKIFLKQEIDLLISIFKLSCFDNIRLMKRAINSFDFIFSKIDYNEKYKQFYQYILSLIITYYLESKVSEHDEYYFAFNSAYNLRNFSSSNTTKEKKSIIDKYRSIYPPIIDANFNDHILKEHIYLYIKSFEYEELTETINVITEYSYKKEKVSVLDYLSNWQYVDEEVFLTSYETMKNDFFDNTPQDELYKYAFYLLHFNYIKLKKIDTTSVTTKYLELLSQLNLKPYFTDQQFYNHRFISNFNSNILNGNKKYDQFINDIKKILINAKKLHTLESYKSLINYLAENDINNFKKLFYEYIHSENKHMNTLPIFANTDSIALSNAILNLTNSNLKYFNDYIFNGYTPIYNDNNSEEKDKAKINEIINELENKKNNLENQFIRNYNLTELLETLKLKGAN
ncbi:P-loop NTPase fold protein [Myroides odoratus]|uniref:P-loop NTPase fold protein n=1 Tax=Myroides odoratus TaxID=256 RepID=UPI0039B0BBE1